MVVAGVVVAGVVVAVAGVVGVVAGAVAAVKPIMWFVGPCATHAMWAVATVQAVAPIDAKSLSGVV